MIRLTNENELESRTGNQVDRVFSIFPISGILMAVSMLLMLGLTSCSKDDISIEPEQAIVLSGPIHLKGREPMTRFRFHLNLPLR
jgi:hypothetical protein